MSTQVPAPTLGTVLRRLVDHLDGAVEAAYVQAGLDYRPRYTPVIRIVRALGPSTLRVIADELGISHSAVSQTIAQMKQAGLVSMRPGDDARERIVALTPKARRMLPRLEDCWAATERAARSLDRELGIDLVAVLRDVLGALDARSFAARIEDPDA